MSGLMARDVAILARIEDAFADAARPSHFTNHRHCDECAEHDALLLARDRSTLSLDDVGHPSWDPICFCSAAGIAYYFPALACIALSSSQGDDIGYVEQLVFHLASGHTDNLFFRHCDDKRRAAVATLLAHLIDTRAAAADRSGGADDLLRCHALWANEQHLPQTTRHDP